MLNYRNLVRKSNKRTPKESTWDLGGELVNFSVTVSMKDGQKYNRILSGTSAYSVMKEVENKLNRWSRKADVSGFSVGPIPKK